MLITVHLTQQFNLQSSLFTVLATLSDIETTGRMLPDVESVKQIGADLYAWEMLPRRAFGVTFIGNYVSQYRITNDKISWDTISGNMLSRGSFNLLTHGDGVNLLVDIYQEFDLPIPALAVSAVQLYTRQKIYKGVTSIVNMIMSATPEKKQSMLP